MATLAEIEETRVPIGHNPFVDSTYVIPFLQLIEQPHAMEALAREKHAAEGALAQIEQLYMDSQYRLTQLNEQAPEASGDTRATIDRERHDLRHRLEDLPNDIEHVARKFFEAENRIADTLVSMAAREIDLAYQVAMESKDSADVDRHKKLKDFISNLRHVLIRHESPAGAANHHRLEIERRYSSLQGIEREYRRRKQGGEDALHFPGLVEELSEINSAYDDRQAKRLAKLAGLFEEAFQDAERTLGAHRGVAADLSAIERRGNAPHGYRVPGTAAERDLSNLREIEAAMKRIKR